MDSDSSCTYKDLVSDYRSTKDSELWSLQEMSDSETSRIFNVSSIPFLLKDDTTEDHYSKILTIDNIHMEEMMVEPLLWIPESCATQLHYITRSRRDSLFASMSTYGVKHLAFIIPGCLLCRDNFRTRLYIPQRFLKKVVYDCRSKGVDCDFKGSHLKDLYHSVDVDPKLQLVCESVCRHSLPRSVKSALTPIHSDGFNEYYPVQVVVYIILNPDRKLGSSSSSEDTVVFKHKRQIQVFPLNIYKS